MIQDASFLIDVLNGDDDAQTVLELIERENRAEKIASVTSLELYEGIERSQKPEQEKRVVLRILDSKHVVPADHSIMRHAGELSGRLIENGEQIDRRGLHHRSDCDSRERACSHAKGRPLRPDRQPRRRDLLSPPGSGIRGKIPRSTTSRA